MKSGHALVASAECIKSEFRFSPIICRPVTVTVDACLKRLGRLCLKYRRKIKNDAVLAAKIRYFVSKATV